MLWRYYFYFMLIPHVILFTSIALLIYAQNVLTYMLFGIFIVIFIVNIKFLLDDLTFNTRLADKTEAHNIISYYINIILDDSNSYDTLYISKYVYDLMGITLYAYVTTKVKIKIDPNRKNIDVGVEPKQKIISNVNNFFDI